MKKTLLMCVMIAAACTSGMALAQTNHAAEMANSIAKVHGGLEELARTCGLHTSEELARMKTTNREKLARENGLAVASFDRLHAQGQEEVKAKFAGLDTAQRQQACEQAKALQNIPAVRR